MSDAYIYDKQLIRVNETDTILVESKSSESIHQSYISFKNDNGYIPVGFCYTDKKMKNYEWMEYDIRYIALFSRIKSVSNVRITKLFDMHLKQFVQGDDQELLNKYLRRKNKIKSKK